MTTTIRDRDFVRVTQHGEVTLVTMDRPPANAIERQLADELADTFCEIASSATAVVITGSGECFSAGLDLKIVPRYGEAETREMRRALTRMVYEIYRCPVPTVAAIAGHAVAAGTLIALATDYRVAVDQDARFGLPGVRVGIPYPAAALAVIEAELDPATRRRLMLQAKTFGPTDAIAYGIVDELLPLGRVLPRAYEVAEDLASMPSAAYARVKHDLRRKAIDTMHGLLRSAPSEAHDAWLTEEAGRGWIDNA